MRDRIRVFVLVSVVTIGVAPLGWAQSGNGWTAPMTPWGEPDLMGVWTSATLTPLERPERFGDKAELTAEEASAMERQTFETRVANDGKAAPGSVGSGPSSPVTCPAMDDRPWLVDHILAPRAEFGSASESAAALLHCASVRDAHEHIGLAPGVRSCSLPALS